MIRRVVALALILALVAPALLACPTCSESLKDSAGHDALAKGFAYSIYLMLLIPFAIVGGGIAFVWRTARKRQALLDGGPGSVNPTRQALS